MTFENDVGVIVLAFSALKKGICIVFFNFDRLFYLKVSIGDEFSGNPPKRLSKPGSNIGSKDDNFCKFELKM